MKRNVLFIASLLLAFSITGCNLTKKDSNSNKNEGSSQSSQTNDSSNSSHSQSGGQTSTSLEKTENYHTYPSNYSAPKYATFEAADFTIKDGVETVNIQHSVIINDKEIYGRTENGDVEQYIKGEYLVTSEYDDEINYVLTFDAYRRDPTISGKADWYYSNLSTTYYTYALALFHAEYFFYPKALIGGAYSTKTGVTRTFDGVVCDEYQDTLDTSVYYFYSSSLNIIYRYEKRPTTGNWWGYQMSNYTTNKAAIPAKPDSSILVR